MNYWLMKTEPETFSWEDQVKRGAKGEHPHPYGKLILSRKPAGAGSFTLDVNFSISTRGPSGMRTQASVT